jgi:hypothetical protein
LRPEDDGEGQDTDKPDEGDMNNKETGEKGEEEVGITFHLAVLELLLNSECLSA